MQLARPPKQLAHLFVLHFETLAFPKGYMKDLRTVLRRNHLTADGLRDRHVLVGANTKYALQTAYDEALMSADRNMTHDNSACLVICRRLHQLDSTTK